MQSSYVFEVNIHIYVCTCHDLECWYFSGAISKWALLTLILVIILMLFMLMILLIIMLLILLILLILLMLSINGKTTHTIDTNIINSEMLGEGMEGGLGAVFFFTYIFTTVDVVQKQVNASLKILGLGLCHRLQEPIYIHNEYAGHDA